MTKHLILLKSNGYHRGLASMVYDFFNKKSTLLAQSETLAARDKSASSGAAKNKNMLNQHPLDLACTAKVSDHPQELAEKLQKLIIRKIEKMKSTVPFIHNIWGADLADMQLISRFIKGIGFLLCVIDIFSKYARVIPLKDKKVL